MLNKIKFSLRDDEFKKYFSNSSWMLFEQILRIFSGVFVGIYIARYLGPSNFGILSYALAISVFLIAISRLGMDSVLLREMVKVGSDIGRQNRLLGTAIWLMLFFSVSVFASLLIIFSALDEDLEVKICIFIVCLSSLFTPFLAIDYFYQSQFKAKISAVCKITSIAVMSLVKLVLIYVEADLIYFALAFLFDHIFLAVFLLITIFNSKGWTFFCFFEFKLAKRIMKSSWLMVVASVAVIINLRVDQIMIKEFIGFEEAGVYSAAVKFYESWAVLPNTIAISLLPAIFKLKEVNPDLYHKRIAQLIRVLFWMSVLVSTFTAFFSDSLVLLTFGPAYSESAALIGIVMWSSVFIALGSVSARYFTMENMERKILVRALVATFSNVILNLIFIPIYGLPGAALTTLFCAILSGYLMDWFDEDLKILLRLKHKAIFLRSL
jgi:O-antigen/teichoic acid export membrane protein